MGKIVILMGSASDFDYCRRIRDQAEDFVLDVAMRIGSAHKTPRRVLEVIEEFEEEEDLVYITVAGRSNALSGLVDAQTAHPVIASPPYSCKFAGFDIFSSLRMPSGVAPMVVLGPEETALAAAKILGVTDEHIRERVRTYQQSCRERIRADDEEVKRG